MTEFILWQLKPWVITLCHWHDFSSGAFYGQRLTNWKYLIQELMSSFIHKACWADAWLWQVVQNTFLGQAFCPSEHTAWKQALKFWSVLRNTLYWLVYDWRTHAGQQCLPELSLFATWKFIFNREALRWSLWGIFPQNDEALFRRMLRNLVADQTAETLPFWKMNEFFLDTCSQKLKLEKVACAACWLMPGYQSD